MRQRFSLVVIVILLLGLAASVALASTGPPIATPQEPGVWITHGPRGGRALTLEVSPSFASDGVAFSGEWLTSYQSTEAGLGIVRSGDGGETWTISDAGTGDVDYASAVHDFGFSPAFSVDQTVFAATWGGLFRSVDGVTWTWLEEAYSGPPGAYMTIEVAPDFDSSQQVLAGDLAGLLRSDDGGETWDRLDDVGAAMDIAFSPSYAVDGTAFSSDGASVYRSEDGALTWAGVLTAPVTSLVVSPAFSGDQTVFGSGGAHFYTSDDGGTTWISRTVHSDVTMINALAVSPQYGSDRTLFAGASTGLYWSQDGGVTWEAIGEYEGIAVRSLAISPQWPQHAVLLVGTDAGVYRMLSTTPTSGNVRQATSGFAALSASPLDWSAEANLLLTATRNHGVYGSRDGGRSWQAMGLQAGTGYYGFSDVAISPDFVDDETLLAAWLSGTGIGGAVYRSTDGGASWESVYSTDYVGDVAFSPGYESDQTMFATSGDNGLVRSTNGGDDWEEVGSWLGGGAHGVAQYVALPPDYPTDSTVFVGGSQGVWKLPAGMTTWQSATSGITAQHTVVSLAVSPDYGNDQTLLALASWSGAGGGQLCGVFRSLDGGANWQQASAGIAPAELFDVTFSPQFAQDRTAYVTTRAGDLYRSQDGGTSWTRLGSPPGTPPFYDVLVREDGRIFVGSQQGVWQYATALYDLIVNGGFEGTGGWTMPVTEYPAVYTDEEAYEGNRSARLGIVSGSNVFSYSSVYQDISIPSGIEQATLAFAQLPLSESSLLAPRAAGWPASEALNPAGGDAQYALLLDPADTDVIMRELFWELSNSGAWQLRRYDLSSFAGQTVRLHYGVYNDGAGGRAAMYVDAVSLLVRYPGAHSVHLPLFFGP